MEFRHSDEHGQSALTETVDERIASTLLDTAVNLANARDAVASFQRPIKVAEAHMYEHQRARILQIAEALLEGRLEIRDRTDEDEIQAAVARMEMFTGPTAPDPQGGGDGREEAPGA